MEITAKEAGSRPVVRGKNRSTHFLRLMNFSARSKSADLKALVVARGRQMESAPSELQFVPSGLKSRPIGNRELKRYIHGVEKSVICVILNVSQIEKGAWIL